MGIVFEPLRNRQPPRPLPVCPLAKMISAPANGSGARLQIAGERQSGQDVRSQNVTAVSAIANIVKTSLGPVGLDKVRACMLRLAGMGSALSALAVYSCNDSSPCKLTLGKTTVMFCTCCMRRCLWTTSERWARLLDGAAVSPISGPCSKRLQRQQTRLQVCCLLSRSGARCCVCNR